MAEALAEAAQVTKVRLQSHSELRPHGGVEVTGSPLRHRVGAHSARTAEELLRAKQPMPRFSTPEGVGGLAVWGPRSKRTENLGFLHGRLPTT